MNIPFAQIVFGSTPLIGAIGGSWVLKQKIKNGKTLLAKNGVQLKTENWGKVREELRRRNIKY